MTQAQVEQLVKNQSAKEESAAYQWVETHISWLILGAEHVFKIKKPVRFSFLDFSTVEKRKFYCQEEVRLNRRLSPDMYLGVVPIRKTTKGVTIGEGRGLVVDYAVLMRRMDESKQMDRLLSRGEVSGKQVEQIAEQLAYFHRSAIPVKSPLELSKMEEDFVDILKVQRFIHSQLGSKAALLLTEIVQVAKQFLQEHAFQLYVRKLQGWTIDGHGDLHSRNIFLLDPPVIFDCIEFDEHFRQVDVLDELAFLCMDLNFHHREDLEQQFLNCYLQLNSCMPSEADRQLFLYYKLYRANVRLKVEALQAIQQAHTTAKELDRIQRYFALMQSYYQQLTSLEAS